MVIGRWSTPFVALLVLACSPAPRDNVAKEQSERDELVDKMKQHPSLEGGETRNGPDSDLLPPPGKPAADSSHPHMDHPPNDQHPQ